MASYDEILGQVPLQQLASQWGVDESEVEQAVQTALPALLGGLQANAHDPAGAQSLASALADHQGTTVSSLADVDEQDGQKIVGNIFGDNTDQVMSQLGGVGSGIGGSGSAGSIVQKLLPILAPIVMSWLANKIGQGGGLGSILGGGSGSAEATGSSSDNGPLFPGGQGAGSGSVQSPGGDAPAASGSNPLEDILGQVLGGASGGSGGSSPGGGAGDILGGILGGLLGGGKR
ncbi:uncharacterized protein DUF937 [Humibacillus xanthopallidus]|uniref:Uncharacterized protein DUF937 n=1 Tax=Humibacillus xanthopallidus TaxID=412689 RepID=A0A543PSK2_9MICO|nr:DUF937 domain-containing protein [Humibacillus xanthopallidus]TQN47063.1 uncharacterized protein DUF937 [Humibacillus xanthopallidus]